MHFWWLKDEYLSIGKAPKPTSGVGGSRRQLYDGNCSYGACMPDQYTDEIEMRWQGWDIKYVFLK